MKTAFVTALALLAASAVHADGSAALAEPLATAPEALSRIAEAGYHAPFDLSFRHGLWTAEATALDGRRVDLVVDATTGEVWTDGAAQGGILDSTRVRELLVAAGYTQIDDIEFDDGFWEAEARNPAGRHVDLVIHPLTGAVLAEVADDAVAPGGLLGAAEIRAALTAAGYTDIRDLEFDDGFWEAEARNSAGRRVELRVDPRTGAVVHEERD